METAEVSGGGKIKTVTGKLVDRRFYAFCEWYALRRLYVGFRADAMRSVVKALDEYVQDLGQWPDAYWAIADVLGVSTSTLYAWRRTEQFWVVQAQLADEWREASQAAREAVSITTSLMPGREGFNDRKMLNEKDGTLVKKHEVKNESKVDVNVTVKSVRSMTEKELSKLMFRELQKQFPDKGPEEIAGIQKALLRTAEEAGMPDPEEEGTHVPLARQDAIDVPWEDWEDAEESEDEEDD